MNIREIARHAALAAETALLLAADAAGWLVEALDGASNPLPSGKLAREMAAANHPEPHGPYTIADVEAMRGKVTRPPYVSVHADGCSPFLCEPGCPIAERLDELAQAGYGDRYQATTETVCTCAQPSRIEGLRPDRCSRCFGLTPWPKIAGGSGGGGASTAFQPCPEPERPEPCDNCGARPGEGHKLTCGQPLCGAPQTTQPFGAIALLCTRVAAHEGVHRASGTDEDGAWSEEWAR